MNKGKRIHILVECAILIALSSVLSFVKIWHMPLGGSVTLVSMLPVAIIGIRHGMKWGIGSAFVYALFQLVFGIADGLLGWGLTPVMLVGCMFFDYIAAFTVLGLSGIFRNRGEKGVYSGLAFSIILRFVSSFLSGYVIFTNLDKWEVFNKVFSRSPALYSICYNGLFMLPELVLTLLVAAILLRIKPVRRIILTPQN